MLRQAAASGVTDGHIEVVRLRLEKGANVAVTNNDGGTPLYAASLIGHAGVLKLLLKEVAAAYSWVGRSSRVGRGRLVVSCS
jgi:hypothetical protein